MKVFLATPCHGSSVSMHYAASVFALSYEAAQHGLDFTLKMHSESLITRARNKIVADFMEAAGFTHLLWIDADVSFSPQAVFRLLLADRDVAAGLYPLKTETWPADGVPALSSRKDLDALTTRYPLYPVLGQAGPSEAAVDADGFVEVVAAPTGFMAIKRGVIERMMAHYPDLACAAGDGNPESRHWCLFDCMVEPETRRYLSEDYAFCRRWRDMGGRIFADVNSQLGHLAQRLIEGDLAYSLTRRGKL